VTSLAQGKVHGGGVKQTLITSVGLYIYGSSPNLPSLGGFGWLGKEIYGVEALHQWRRESVDEVAQI
jgi:hypothetical protein